MIEDLPLVSIVTPSFNQANFIEDAILSVKNQDYPNIEHIVVDGKSADNTTEILKKHEKNYNLRWISEPDEGQSDAVNKGFMIAKGKIIGWLNSDDVYFASDVISYIVKQFKKNPDVDVIFGDSVVINENGFIERVFRTLNWNYLYLLLGASYIPQPATFFRKNVITENSLDKNLHFAMDVEFWLRLGKKHKFLHVNKLLAADRVHIKTKRLSSSNIKRYRLESKKIRERHGLNANNYFSLLHYLLTFYIHVMIRLRGIKSIFELEKNNKLFLSIRLKNKYSLILSQLIPSSEISYIRRVIRTHTRE
jgi:glycosyltransferase involved in cell wall biosynthesis